MTLQEFLSLIEDEEARIELEIDDGTFDEYVYHHFWLSDFRTNDDIISKSFRYYTVSNFSFVTEQEESADIMIHIKPWNYETNR